jgi:hypothetical protein
MTEMIQVDDVERPATPAEQEHIDEIMAPFHNPAPTK